MNNAFIKQWVDEMAALTLPDEIVWIDGSKEQIKKLTSQAVATGELQELNQDKLPNCYHHRTAQNDVARVEHLTFICTTKEEDCGPTNNWMQKEEAYLKLTRLFRGSMRGRSMYVIPYLMGPKGSEFSKVGIELTDSIYVVLNMNIMSRIGNVAMEVLGNSNNFVKGLHSKGELDPNKRFICHFPEDNTIWSIGSGYGGNVLLGKKCFALRIASSMGKKEGWLAEHMLILGLEAPNGKITYIAAAFPSACGKTNLAMLIPPKQYKGYKVWTVGDDIAWFRTGEDGKLWAINPEAGFFGVAPGTSIKTNPNALQTVQKNTIFTNVVVTPDNTVWWEGMGIEPPERGVDWQGNEWSPNSGKNGAHPNSRFTAPASQCPSISNEWESPQGVPISAIIFGGRRAKVAPLVVEAFDRWSHKVFMGVSMASETTAAATGQVGKLRRDPMAMLPFCGYNMGEYFNHWLDIGEKLKKPPKIFHVNWFRTDENGNFIWPGFGENIRVLEWIVKRCNSQVEALESPIGLLPDIQDINIEGLKLSPGDIEMLLSINEDCWIEDANNLAEFLSQFGKTLPVQIRQEQEMLLERLGVEA